MSLRIRPAAAEEDAVAVQIDGEEVHHRVRHQRVRPAWREPSTDGAADVQGIRDLQRPHLRLPQVRSVEEDAHDGAGKGGARGRHDLESPASGIGDEVEDAASVGRGRERGPRGYEPIGEARGEDLEVGADRLSVWSALLRD